MIEINLLPEEFKKKEPKFKGPDLSKFKMQNIPILKISFAALGILVVIQLLLFAIGIYMKGNLNSTEKHYSQILPKKREADTLKTQIETINKKVGAIDELMVKRFSWAKKLNDLGDSMTPGIWLTELSYSEKLIDRPVIIQMRGSKNKGQPGPSRTLIEKALVKYLVISGYATSLGEDGTAAVGKFIKSLKDNPSFYADFSEIELGAIKREKIENQEVMSFKITCLFKEAK